MNVGDQEAKDGTEVLFTGLDLSSPGPDDGGGGAGGASDGGSR